MTTRKKSSVPRKKGQLSLEEQDYIKQNFNKLSIDQIADHLNRSTAPVKKYISENSLSEDSVVDSMIRQKLYAKSFWSEIQKQFDEPSGELQYFEATWINLIKQFREDVLPAEELQIKQFITIDILINRSMKERKRHISETEKLQKQVDFEYSIPESDRDTAKLSNLETQLSFARNSIANYTNEYTKLLAEQQRISKDLKATREQRIKRIEDGKSSWIGLIRMLEDEETREKQGREMEILSMATQKFKQNLQTLHEYADGNLDKPFLFPEQVEEENDE